MDDRLLSTSEAAQFLGLDPGTLKRWRSKNSKLPFVKVSANRARYSLDALRKFVSDRTQRSTADSNGAA
jgi:predicted site-specific integrase-resolvase